MDELPEGWEIVPGPRCRCAVIGDFVCPGCGGVADIWITEVRTRDWHLVRLPRRDHVVTWWAPWCAYVTVELICQGPGDLDAPDEAWDHAGTTIDMLATGYEPASLN